MHNQSITAPGGWRRIAACAALLGIQLLLPACADPRAGETLFAQQCSQCHRAGPGSLQTPAEQVVDMLQSGSVRAHRFRLEQGQLRDLGAYLTEVKAARP